MMMNRPVETADDPGAAKAIKPGLPLRCLMAIFRGINRIAPGRTSSLQKRLIGVGYNYVSHLGRRSQLTFMNYGYAADEIHGDLVLQAADQPNHYSIRLYDRVLAGRDLRGKDILEVGSGLGGGASYVMRYRTPRSVTGVDYAASAVEFCREHYHLDGLKFIVGDAEALPVPDASVDIVLNVESSHNYPSFERFVAEVHRVLKPGGEFLFADLRLRDAVAAMRAQLAQRFEVIAEEPITPNVLRAMRDDAERRRALIEKDAPAAIKRPLRNFSGLPGSPTYEALAAGKMEYIRFALKKPAGSVPVH
jgi:ubiquinone/menaquinone biosynthesis C-methylase UbiE